MSTEKQKPSHTLAQLKKFVREQMAYVGKFSKTNPFWKNQDIVETMESTVGYLETDLSLCGNISYVSPMQLTKLKNWVKETESKWLYS